MSFHLEERENEDREVQPSIIQEKHQQKRKEITSLLQSFQKTHMTTK